MQNNIPDFDSFKATCHACDKERQYKYLKVSTHDTSRLFGHDTGSMFINVRYCIDSAPCKDKAFNREWAINKFFNGFMEIDYKVEL